MCMISFVFSVWKFNFHYLNSLISLLQKWPVNQILTWPYFRQKRYQFLTLSKWLKQCYLALMLNCFGDSCQVEFVAEDEMVEIVPNMRMEPLRLICVCLLHLFCSCLNMLSVLLQRCFNFSFLFVLGLFFLLNMLTVLNFLVILNREIMVRFIPKYQLKFHCG